LLQPVFWKEAIEHFRNAFGKGNGSYGSALVVCSSGCHGHNPSNEEDEEISVGCLAPAGREKQQGEGKEKEEQW
jgi:hypothetical protein